MDITLDYLKNLVAECEEYYNKEEGSYSNTKHELSSLFDDDRLQEIVDNSKEDYYNEEELCEDLRMLFEENYDDNLKSVTVKDNTGKVISDYRDIDLRPRFEDEEEIVELADRFENIEDYIKQCEILDPDSGEQNTIENWNMENKDLKEIFTSIKDWNTRTFDAIRFIEDIMRWWKWDCDSEFCVWDPYGKELFDNA